MTIIGTCVRICAAPATGSGGWGLLISLIFAIAFAWSGYQQFGPLGAIAGFIFGALIIPIMTALVILLLISIVLALILIVILYAISLMPLWLCLLIGLVVVVLILILIPKKGGG